MISALTSSSFWSRKADSPLHDFDWESLDLRGRLEWEVPMARYCWFRVGGSAGGLYRPADWQDLQVFMQNRPTDIPVHVIGAASNLILRDGGVPGIMVKPGRGMNDIRLEPGTNGVEIYAEAGALDIQVARFALQHGLTGLEFLNGIPGTVGGGVMMNAGAYGGMFSSVLTEVDFLDEHGEHQTCPVDALGFSYRHAEIPPGWIVTGARFRPLGKDNIATIAQKMDDIAQSRQQSQPVRSRTGGSTFKNPPGQKAWQLIDQAGGRGLEVGGARMSDMHCNFMINTGTATAQDLEELGEQVRIRVKENSGVDLEWEIHRIGVEA